MNASQKTGTTAGAQELQEGSAISWGDSWELRIVWDCDRASNAAPPQLVFDSNDPGLTFQLTDASATDTYLRGAATVLPPSAQACPLFQSSKASSG